MKELPKISIVVPSFNQGEYIEETLVSIIEQGHANKEIIVIDGGSTDNTVDIIRKYESAISYWCSEPDEGQSHAINKGLEVASGDILCWLNSDDLFEPGSLTVVADNLENCELGWVTGSVRLIKSDSSIIAIREPRDVSLNTFLEYKLHWLAQPSTFWTRELMDKVGTIDSKLHYIMDLDLFYRFFEITPPKTTRAVLSCFRVHADAKTSSSPSAVDQEYARWLKQLVLSDREGDAILDKVLSRYIYLQRCYRTMSEHIVISKFITLWKRFVNKKIYT